MLRKNVIVISPYMNFQIPEILVRLLQSLE